MNTNPGGGEFGQRQTQGPIVPKTAAEALRPLGDQTLNEFQQFVSPVNNTWQNCATTTATVTIRDTP